MADSNQDVRSVHIAPLMTALGLLLKKLPLFSPFPFFFFLSSCLLSFSFLVRDFFPNFTLLAIFSGLWEKFQEFLENFFWLIETKSWIFRNLSFPLVWNLFFFTSFNPAIENYLGFNAGGRMFQQELCLVTGTSIEMSVHHHKMKSNLKKFTIEWLVSSFFDGRKGVR